MRAFSFLFSAPCLRKALISTICIIRPTKRNRAYKVHNEETFRNFQASLEALKQIIRDQRTVIGAVQHERDLLAVGYVEAMKECEELKALLKASNDSDTPCSKHG